jgi:transcriptional regulator with XRE-family HTH domain
VSKPQVTPWWQYVQAEMDRRGWAGADLARAARISHTRVTRWREGQAPSIDAARGVANAFDTPLLTVLVEAGLITSGEAGQESLAPARAEDLSAEQLAAEVLKRMKANEVSDRPRILTTEEIAADPNRYQVINLGEEPAQQREVEGETS